MSKRRASDLEQEVKLDRGVSKRRRIQNERVDGVLSQGKTAVFRALKVARGFERQKLGRRQKDARTKKDEAASTRLESEVSTLKQLDLEQLGELYLYRTLCKIKSIADAEAFPTFIRDKVEEASKTKHDTAYSNVTSRLFTANPTKTALEEVLKKVRRALGVKDGNQVKEKSQKAGLQPRDESADTESESDAVETSVQGDAGRDASESEEFEGFDELLGNASNDEESDGGRNLRESSFSPIRTGITRPSVKGSQEQREKDSDQVMVSSSGSEEDVQPSTKQKPFKVTSHDSAFIPSLMGGYISGSDSQPDSEEEMAADIKPRKNRQGQQARRAKWERKFGQNANHVKKLKESRDAGWDMKRGAQDHGNTRGTKRTGRSDATGFAGKSQRPKQAGERPPRPTPGTKEKGAAGPLHPSWEAARRKKAQKSQTVSLGTKVRFD